MYRPLHQIELGNNTPVAKGTYIIVTYSYTLLRGFMWFGSTYQKQQYTPVHFTFPSMKPHKCVGGTPLLLFMSKMYNNGKALWRKTLNILCNTWKKSHQWTHSLAWNLISAWVEPRLLLFTSKERCRDARSWTFDDVTRGSGRGSLVGA